MNNDISFGASPLDASDFDFTASVDSSALPNGWYKIQLADFGDVKPAKSGSCEGAIFTFAVVDGAYRGQNFTVWFATRQLTAKGGWLVQKFRTIFARIAQTVGVSRLATVSQLIDKPFFALVRRTTSKRRRIDETTGEEREEISYNNEFGVVPADSILSIEEYYRTRSDSDADFEVDFKKFDGSNKNADDLPF